ncbi:MAG: hypothetical protein HY794_06825 [Desulfarculus sp.]|nr:hypothetical protein [Desulfarculus sp.]
MGRRPGRSVARLWSWLCLALLAGCAQAPPAAPPSLPAEVPAGVVSGASYLNKALELYWMAPAGYQGRAPQGQTGLLVTWAAPQGRLTASLWLLPQGPEGQMAQAGAQMAATRGWQAQGGRDISWQGRACWDATYTAGDRLVRARLLPHRQGLLMVEAQTALAASDELKAEAAALLEGLRLWPAHDLLHTARRGEGLELVALWYCGRAETWRRLRDYNRLPSPLLRPGQEVLIPRELVWRLDPMPSWMPRLARPAAPVKAPAGRAPAKAAESPPEEPGEGLPDLDLAPTGPK